eukprot:7279845-Pyramimonas_sp.AAC.1
MVHRVCVAGSYSSEVSWNAPSSPVAIAPMSSNVPVLNRQICPAPATYSVVPTTTMPWGLWQKP